MRFLHLVPEMTATDLVQYTVHPALLAAPPPSEKFRPGAADRFLMQGAAVLA